MAHSKITLVNEVGQEKTIPVGYSWTFMFFGCFVPLIRGEWKFFWMTLLLGILNGYCGGLLFIIGAFWYNQFSLDDWKAKGYFPKYIKDWQ